MWSMVSACRLAYRGRTGKYSSPRRRTCGRAPSWAWASLPASQGFSRLGCFWAWKCFSRLQIDPGRRPSLAGWRRWVWGVEWRDVTNLISSFIGIPVVLDQVIGERLYCYFVHLLACRGSSSRHGRSPRKRLLGRWNHSAMGLVQERIVVVVVAVKQMKWARYVGPNWHLEQEKAGTAVDSKPLKEEKDNANEKAKGSKPAEYERSGHSILYNRTFDALCDRMRMLFIFSCYSTWQVMIVVFASLCVGVFFEKWRDPAPFQQKRRRYCFECNAKKRSKLWFYPENEECRIITYNSYLWVWGNTEERNIHNEEQG